MRRSTTIAATIALSATAVLTPAAAVADGNDVVIVGDSIVAGNQNLIGPALEDRGHDVTIDAQSGRSLVRSLTIGGTRVRSGVEAVRELVASGRTPALWVIELGTNDHHVAGSCGCADPVAAAGQMIDLLLAELPDEANVAWVSVLDTDLPDSVRWFNTALAVRGLQQIAWFDAARDRPTWFLDDVHPSIEGVDALVDVLDGGIDAYLDGAPPRERSARRLGVRAYEI